MKVLFLDIDGVLNNPGTLVKDDWVNRELDPKLLQIPVEPACIEIMNRIVEATGANVVISSSWRYFAHYPVIAEALARYGLVANIIDEIPNLKGNPEWREAWRTRDHAPHPFSNLEEIQRGMEIVEWLGVHPEVTHFCILDDQADMHTAKPWHVEINGAYGLNYGHIEEVVRLMADSAPNLLSLRNGTIGYTP